MLVGFDLKALISSTYQWLKAQIWTTSTLFEIAAIAFSVTLGTIIGRILYQRATRAIDSSNLPLSVKRIARSARRVLPAVVSLAVLFIITSISRLDPMNMDDSISIAAMKAMMAWIAIRLSLQFIQNSLLRSFATWTIWAVAALSIFGVLDESMNTLDGFAIQFGSFRVSILEIIKSVLLLVLLLYFATFVSSFFERKVLKTKNLSRSSQVLIVKIIRMILVVIAIIIGITSAGIDLSIFAVFSGAVGLGIGFGLQRSVSNLFSGMLLLMDQSIKPGDIVELEKDGAFGVVTRMAARYTEIVTLDNKSYLIPNEDFITQRVVNWSHLDSLVRLQVLFGVHYDSNPHDVIRIATDAVKGIGGRIASHPAPKCYLKEFGDSALNFVMTFWIDDPQNDIFNVKGDVLLALWDAFQNNGIKIPYPHREVFMHDMTEN
jgi:small-conductance mechanosensitive channel